MEPQFYWPDSGPGLGVLRAECPHIYCRYVGYFAVQERKVADGLYMDTVIGHCLMEMHREHPLHFCSTCMQRHEDKDGIGNADTCQYPVNSR